MLRKLITQGMEDKPTYKKPQIPLDPRSLVIYRKVAGDFADRYIEDFLFSHICRITGLPADSAIEPIKETLEDPLQALKVFYGHYAFSRRGKDREDLARAAQQALEAVTNETDFETILAAEDGVMLWDAFEKSCQEMGKKSHESQNRGLIQGMLELAQEIYANDKQGSIASWVVDGVAQSGEMETQFLRIVDIRGVGPKSTSTFLRDMLFIFGLEGNINPTDRVYVQPIDRWLRLMSRYVVPESNMEKSADWIVAGKVSKYCRRARVSSLRFNMGTTYFGQKLVKDPSRFAECVKNIITEAAQN